MPRAAWAVTVGSVVRGALARGSGRSVPSVVVLVPPAVATQDFLMQGPRDHGVAGLINLFGIESPGLTSSLAIADHVAELADI